MLRHISSSIHAVATTPAESLDAYIALFSNDSGLPWFTGRSASALHFSRPAQLTLRPACLPSRPRRPSTPKASAASLPPPLLRLLPAGATFAGWDSHPLKMCTLPRRTVNRCVTLWRCTISQLAQAGHGGVGSRPLMEWRGPDEKGHNGVWWRGRLSNSTSLRSPFRGKKRFAFG